MTLLMLVISPDFWDKRRRWPAGCRPVVYSTDLVMRNAGLLRVPSEFEGQVEGLLEDHPAVVSVVRARAVPSAPHPGETALRTAA